MLQKIHSCLMIAICYLSLGGCAGYNITKGGTGAGYDVFRPEPYLMIKPGEKGPVGEIVWLPNYKERYRIDTWNFLSKADFQFDITDGWKLTKISDKSDNTTIADKLLDVAQKSIKEGTIALTGDVLLFRLVYDENGYFTGLKQVAPQ
jgi:hypothetical protein